MLASIALVGCTNDDVLENSGNEQQNGEQAFIAVNIVNSNVTSRGTSDSFENGSNEENAFDKATFFFYDASGNPYFVAGANNFVEKDYSDVTITENTGNVEEKVGPVLVIEKSQNVPPQKLLVILNAPIGLNGLSLDKVREEVGSYGLNVTTDAEPKVTYTSGSKFVISNSVYKNTTTNNIVDAVDLTAANIAPDATKANQNPVNVFVERTVAKVRVADSRLSTSVNQTVKDESNNDVEIHAQIVGWKVTNITNKTNLLKKINTSWDDNTLGLTWNDAPNYRSYWADTENKTVVHPWAYNELTNAATGNSNYDYYFENTKANDEATETTSGTHNKSQLLVAVKLVASTDATNTDATGVTICEWFGTKYTLTGLKTAIANSLNTQIYYAADKSSIKPEDITFYQESDNEGEVKAKRYVSYATLDNADNTLTDATFIDEAGNTLTIEQVNAKLAAVHPALIWKDGMSYYYIDIEHFGSKGSDGEFGLVRNHLYDITIGKIEGLGTPVYDPTKIITPEKPVEEYSYISATINILAWRVVKQDVTLN